MVIDSFQLSQDLFRLVSDQAAPEAAERDFMDWAEDNGCYTPTASEMEEDDDGRWSVTVMKEPAAE